MKIAFVISEVEDIVKTGGLADVGKALPQALTDMGHDVRIFMPGYAGVVAGLTPLKTIRTHVKHHPQCTVYQTTIADVPVYLVGHEYFDRPELYAESNQAYEDNGQRFAFFAQAVLDVIQAVDFIPDIISCHDWHTGLTPFFVQQHNANMQAAGLLPYFGATKTTISIHNAAYQGVFPYHEIVSIEPYVGLLHAHDQHNINMLRLGIAYADKITTVSPTYAKELLTHLGSHGLATQLQSRAMDLKGILNGCDYTQWDPATDKLIKMNYDHTDLSGKLHCKKDLQLRFDLPVLSDTPVLGMVCRLTGQKGFDYLMPILGQLMRHDMQLVIVGTGDPYVCKQLKDYQRVHPQKFSFIEGFSNDLAHIVEAGADFFLMPSEFEPCGLNQMYSLAYGTLPIVRAVGGLKDTVTGVDEMPHVATGFVFEEPDPLALLTTIRRALLLYREAPQEYLEMQLRAMGIRFTWLDAAMEYEKLFAQLLAD
jgi:starch synthase